MAFERYELVDRMLIVDRMLELAVQIQQIPSPTFGERTRAEFIYQQFYESAPCESVLDNSGNVYIHLVGQGRKPPLVISAHLDTVFPVKTDLTCVRQEGRISGPGIGDNSLGLAGLFGLYWHFTDQKNKPQGKMSLPGDVWLVANVAEEGLGDLKGMRSVVDRFKDEPMAYIALEGMTLGQIYTKGLGVRRYRIHVHTKGGHSWVDFGNPSAIHEIAELIVKIINLPTPVEPRTTLNVGMVEGGTSVNTIASDATLELDLRSESPQALSDIINQVAALVKDMDLHGGEAIRAYSEVIGDRPAGEIGADHPLVQTAIACFAREGIQVKLKTGSTDANVPLSRGYPAICFGLTTGGGSHTTGEYIETQPLYKGFKILVDFIESTFQAGTIRK